jgi:excisionase family DNA binding protein
MKTSQQESTAVQLVNQSTMAQLLGCSPRTIANLCRRKSIPFIKVGRLVRFQPDIVIKTLASPSNQKEVVQ